jgi:hypothetical protein
MIPPYQGLHRVVPPLPSLAAANRGLIHHQQFLLLDGLFKVTLRERRHRCAGGPERLEELLRDKRLRDSAKDLQATLLAVEFCAGSGSLIGTRDYDDARLRLALCEQAQNLNAVESWHLQIEDDDVGDPHPGCVFDVTGLAHHVHCIPGLFAEILNQCCDIRIVIDDKKFLQPVIHRVHHRVRVARGQQGP